MANLGWGENKTDHIYSFLISNSATATCLPPGKTTDSSRGGVYPCDICLQKLLKKVVSCDCQGSILTQRNKKGEEHLSPTVQATIVQFNHMVNCVITTCLGDSSMQVTDRAKTVEHWNKVARVSCERALEISSGHLGSACLSSALRFERFFWDVQSFNPCLSWAHWARLKRHVVWRVWSSLLSFFFNFN